MLVLGLLHCYSSMNLLALGDVAVESFHQLTCPALWCVYALASILLSPISLFKHPAVQSNIQQPSGQQEQRAVFAPLQGQSLGKMGVKCRGDK